METTDKSTPLLSNQANPQDVSEQRPPLILITTSSFTQYEESEFADRENSKDSESSDPTQNDSSKRKSSQSPLKTNRRSDQRQSDQSNDSRNIEDADKGDGLIPYPKEDEFDEVKDQDNINVEMQPMKSSFLTVPQQHRNMDQYQQIYVKRSSVGLGYNKEPLQIIQEDPRGSVSETQLDKFSVDQYDYREQGIPSARPSSESYQKNKPKTSVVYGSGYSFHVEDILEVSDDSIFIKGCEGNVEKVEITNQLTHDINKISRYYKKPVLLKPLYQGVNITYGWVLLFLGTLANGFIPSWIQYMPAEKYLRIAWRFFLQFFMMIPFAMYERRTGDEKVKAKYSFSYILQLDNLKKLFLSSFTMSTWFMFTLFCFEWTYVSHAIILGNLVNFYLFLYRIIRKDQVHFIEIFGATITSIGVICVLSDSIFFDPDDVPPSAYTYKMTKFIHRQNWQRLIFGNGSSLIVSFLMAKMAKHQAASREIFPPYLNTLLTFFLNMFNLTLYSYFFSGMDFIKDPAWGWYGLFTTQNFVSFFLMCIILGMGSFVSMHIVGKIFEPLVPQTAQLFEPIISTLSLQLLGVQILPNGLTCLGYCFILPGLFSIILGQYFIQQYKKNKS